MSNDIFDCAVVGGGPAGLSAAINLRQRGKTVRILGSAPSLLSKAERVDNYLGLPGLSGNTMMQTFLAHAKQAGLVPEEGKVINALPMGDFFMLNFSSQILQAKTVILCLGVYREAALPGETEFLGRGVSYCATCDGMLYRQRQVVVWGQSADAPKEAEALAALGCHVTYVAAKEPPHPYSFSFRQGRLSAVEGQDKVSGVRVGEEILPCEGVFLLREGIAPAQLTPGLQTEKNHIGTDRTMSTNIPGLFAAGDCTGGPYQIAKAVGEGLVAALSAADYLDKKK